MSENLPTLVPRTLHEAMEFAERIADGKLVAKDFRGSPPDILSAISLAQRWNLDIWAVMEHLSIIQGKRMIDGQLAGALINSLGNIQSPIRHSYSGEGDDRTVKASATFVGETEPREIEVRLGDAKTNNPMWKKQIDQQLAYTANRVWGRRNTPQLFLGVHFQGEPLDLDVGEFKELPTIAAPLTAEQAAAEEAEIIGEPVQVHPHEIPKSANEGWLEWGKRFIAYVRAEATPEAIAQWRQYNNDSLELFAKEDPKLYEGLMTRLHERADQLEKVDGGQGQRVSG